jgi:hypothetical protein
MTERRAASIATDAYIYGYPLIPTKSTGLGIYENGQPRPGDVPSADESTGQSARVPASAINSVPAAGLRRFLSPNAAISRVILPVAPSLPCPARPAYDRRREADASVVGRGFRIFVIVFAKRKLTERYRAGLDVGRELPKLATHVDVAHTCWYLEAVPELLELATERLAGASARRETMNCSNFQSLLQLFFTDRFRKQLGASP